MKQVRSLTDAQLQQMAEKVKRARDEKHYSSMRRRLEHSVDSKTNTIVIGVLDIMEKNVGFMWGHGQHDLTEDQKAMRVIWESVRSKILDHGNTKKRAILNNVNDVVQMPKDTIVMVNVDEVVNLGQ